MQVRSDAGLFTLQQAALIIGHLWALGDTGLRKRVLSILHQKGETLGGIRCDRLLHLTPRCLLQPACELLVTCQWHSCIC